MYNVNGVDLDNVALGWSLLFRSNPITSNAKNLASVTVPGRHGVLSGIPAFKAAPTQTLVIRTPGTNLEALYALFEKNNGTGIFRKTADVNRAAVFELVSMDPQVVNGSEELVNLTVTLRFPTADWRDTSETITANAAPASPVHTYSLLSGIGGDIADGSIFLSGDFGNMVLKDVGSGSWVKTVQTFPYSSGTGLLYVGATGQAFRATTGAPWTPVTDMSQYIDTSGGGGFRITPTWVSDPSARIAKLELTTTNQSGVNFRLRAFNSYAIRNGA